MAEESTGEEAATGRARTYGPRADLALSTFVKLVRAHNTLYRLEGRHIRRDYGLTQPQFAVLEGIGHLGPMTMGQLSSKMLVTCGNTTVVVDNLERCGLVQRRPSPEDRRATIVDLTAAGQARFERIFPDHAEYMARAFVALEAPEQEALGALLRKLGRHLATHGVVGCDPSGSAADGSCDRGASDRGASGSDNDEREDDDMQP